MSLTNAVGVSMAAGFILALLLTPLVRRFGHGVHLIDIPNERSSHAVPTPRTGGIAILVAILVALAATGALSTTPTKWIVLGAVSLAALSLYDDLRPLPHHFRLVAQIIIAALVVVATQLSSTSIDLPFLGEVSAGPLAIAVTVFWIVAVINGFNFMDGINGIASTQAAICGATLCVLLWKGGDMPGALLAAAIVGAAAGFLAWNLGGSIFMGDVGSAGFGFLLSLLVLRTSAVASGVAAMLPLTPFLIDAGLTLVRRAVRGEKWFSTPHRSHFYQRLVTTGLSHLKVSMMYAGLALLSSGLGLIYEQLSDRGRALGIALLLWIQVMVIVGTTTIFESRRKITAV